MALRPHLREAMLMIAVRDPRDMLLEWLAFGTAMPFAMPSPAAAAEWLAIALNQVASLVEDQWFPNRVVRTDRSATIRGPPPPRWSRRCWKHRCRPRLR